MLKLALRSDELGQPIHLQTTDLPSLVHEVVEELDPFLRARRQTINLSLVPELGSAEIDAAKISDALMNLLINAVKFTPDGGVIGLAGTPDGPERVKFEVADQGMGIDPSTRPYMFEPFFTGFDTMHHSSGEFEYGKRGMGLGLCLVKRFVELHGGEVVVQCVPGEGSRFAFTLPRRPPIVPPLKAQAG